jgi:hypothetical protein
VRASSVCQDNFRQLKLAAPVATPAAPPENVTKPGSALLFLVIATVLGGGCAPLPKAELTAYTASYSDTREVTNGVLDIVAPYERVVMRSAAGDTPSAMSAQPAGAPSSTSRKAARSTMPPRPDPSLFVNPGAVKAPRPLPPADPTLSVDTGATGPPQPAAAVSVDPATPEPAAVGRCPDAGGADPFCYELATAWADIGDPPLVAAYRNLSDVVLRFNDLLVAYANGIDGRLLQQDLNDLSNAVSALTQFAPIAAVSGAGGYIAVFNGAITALAPIAGAAGQIADRARLRSFLLANYDAVDHAIAMMAANSVELYANVGIGTNLFRRMAPPGTGQSLVKRRQDIRRLLANWVVLLNDNRRLLRELRAALVTPDGVETRLNNLGPPINIKIDASLIKKQIATLGTPMLAP